MTIQIQNGSETRQDPEGSIFLSRNRYVEQFLELEGDPVCILLSLADEISAGEMIRVFDMLKFMLLQSRGVAKIDLTHPDAINVAEIEKRIKWYNSIDEARGLLALKQSV